MAHTLHPLTLQATSAVFCRPESKQLNTTTHSLFSALGLAFRALLINVMLHLLEGVEEPPGQHGAQYLQQHYQQRRASHGRADDLHVHRRHLRAAETLVRLLIGEVASRTVVAIEAAREGQVTSPGAVVPRVVRTAAPELALDPSKGLEHFRVPLRVVEAIVDRVLDEPVRVFSVDEDEHEHRRDALQHYYEDQKPAVDPEQGARLPGGAAPAAEGDAHEHQSQEDEEPRRDLRPVDAVVQQIVVAVAERHELVELHEEPDSRGGGRQPEHRVRDVDHVQDALVQVFFTHGDAVCTDACGRRGARWPNEP